MHSNIGDVDYFQKHLNIYNCTNHNLYGLKYTYVHIRKYEQFEFDCKYEIIFKLSKVFVNIKTLI